MRDEVVEKGLEEMEAVKIVHHVRGAEMKRGGVGIGFELACRLRLAEQGSFALKIDPTLASWDDLIEIGRQFAGDMHGTLLLTDPTEPRHRPITRRRE